MKNLDKEVQKVEGETIGHLVDVAKSIVEHLALAQNVEHAYVAVIGQPGQASVTVHAVEMPQDAAPTASV